jgi:type IV pilus assembly protein PilE
MFTDPTSRGRLIARGFTLVEVMIVVAIIGILSAIAIPSYTNYVTQGRITEATSRLSTLQVQMEQFYMDRRTYVGGPACTSDATSSKYFTFSCSGTTTADAFTAQAVGKGAMLGFTYTVNQAGTKATSAVPTGWTSSSSCWVTRKDGSC